MGWGRVSCCTPLIYKLWKYSSVKASFVIKPTTLEHLVSSKWSHLLNVSQNGKAPPQHSIQRRSPSSPRSSSFPRVLQNHPGLWAAWNWAWGKALCQFIYSLFVSPSSISRLKQQKRNPYFYASSKGSYCMFRFGDQAAGKELPGTSGEKLLVGWTLKAEGPPLEESYLFLLVRKQVQAPKLLLPSPKGQGTSALSVSRPAEGSSEPWRVRREPQRW